ncbi:hypothetical protein CYMTET_3704 [Cymbomonas tetramitiformis]|uniref:Uncharacterized protein n=1 Tax=Cymbomonas tetramitiformis TaxID=36881 RepID=A0AAE0LKK5_9CHLO|nr:hypothetical protein CYMTET_3704 [Cymbomonas tetramitiformis]
MLKLGKHPVARAAATSGTVMACGDALCQIIQQPDKSHGFDLARSARFGVAGITLHGPLFYYGFGCVDKMFGPTVNLRMAIWKHNFEIFWSNAKI